MRFTEKPKWKVIMVTAICLIGLLAVIGGSFAAYTNSQAFQRGVARNRDNETVRFTSNYLQSCANETSPESYSGRTALFSEDQKENTSLTIDLYVYNYANGNVNLISQKDIIYDLTITFSKGNGTGYEVTNSDGEALTKTSSSEANTVVYEMKNKTLVGRSANFHKYTITFPGSDLDKLNITATAIPQNISVTNNQILAAVIVPCTGSSTKTFSYEGKFVYEATAQPKDYSGFNYEVSISSGVADATISWDPDLVEIDKFFLLNMKVAEDAISEILQQGSFTFTMNQAEGKGDYLIPFYIKDKDTINEKSWADMQGTQEKPESGVVRFKAVQKTQTTEDTGN